MLTADANNKVSYFTDILAVNTQIGVIFQIHCFQQPNQTLLNNYKEFSGDSVWLLVCRLTTTCCWKSIYQGLKKIKSWNVNVWNIVVQGHQSFVTVSSLSSKFVFINSFHVSDLFLYPLKASEKQRFLMFSGGIKRDQWNEMG